MLRNAMFPGINPPQRNSENQHEFRSLHAIGGRALRVALPVRAQPGEKHRRRGRPRAADFFHLGDEGPRVARGGEGEVLFTTLYREFLRGRRREARATSLEDLPPGEADIAAEDVDRVTRLDAAAVVASLQAVDEVFRAPLTLFYLEDLSYQEIAAALDVPIGTVMSRLSRGKAQLRATLAREETVARSKVVPFSGGEGRKQA